ncbi:hypothetical protein Norbert_60 [Paenibacillus phage Norbert]|uniref:Uncharacterized protein n=5 Tax=Fernvirus jacopo TaxID=2845738 RepID=A0A345ATH1_9CAUD|nr:hypothetical protein HWB74_gp61 [Paenibacillus phage Jacopo]AXF40072.1 hypothetical protein BLOOM_61 [Paenibacillus phage Bloom]AXF40431.1 hypothetical protein LYCANUS1_61 [Paenibacillus phage Genki]AXF42298.1 hypothetical protein LYCANUS2_61 [Paenibacillus phage Gryphonian]AXH45385.1 hypothetical protein DEVRI_61 [Paenibacillus phage DevRi]QVV19469.1 hypothetical protein Bert_67 [Paenibacillus phage Bert]QVV19738.1 hypothetical protein Hobie_58 [Paenibacillus phage Hobie]QVV19870.1 hypot
MSTEINVLFKSMQRDDKKEVLKFELKGNENDGNAQKLVEMAGTIVIFNLPGLTEEVSAEFMNIQRDSKKTVMKLALKGDSEEKALELYKRAGRNVLLMLKPSQMSIEEYYEEDEGLEYTVKADGTVELDQDQVTIEDVETPETKDTEDALPF